MSRTVTLDDWAMEVATNVYRACLYQSLFGQLPSHRYYVTAGELAEIETEIRGLSDADFRQAISDAEDTAWLVYQRVYEKHSTPPAPSLIN